MNTEQTSHTTKHAQGQAQEIEEYLYAQWKRHGRHLEEYASEWLGTMFLVFCVVGVVGLMFAESSPIPRMIPPVSLRLFIAGLMIGSGGGLVAISPPGRLSGAHLNPAVSIGFWILGKMHARDMALYSVSQMLGGLAGALAGRAVFGKLAAQIHFAVLNPAPRITWAEAFWGEVITTFILTLVIYLFVSHKALMQWTPVAVIVTAGILVCLDGNISGAGMNPARWFGPAAMLHFWRLSWVYVFGPVLGASAAAALRRRAAIFRHLPHTGKLFHDPKYRSIFKHDKEPSHMPEGARISGTAPPAVR